MNDVARTNRRSLVAGGLALAALPRARAFAESPYPNRPIRLIAPYPCPYRKLNSVGEQRRIG